jgi:hypothetical protein
LTHHRLKVYTGFANAWQYLRYPQETPDGAYIYEIICSDGRWGGKTLLIRGQKVILDVDLAELYGVTTKVINQAVKRNIDRFLRVFLFQLTADKTFLLSGHNL